MNRVDELIGKYRRYGTGEIDKLYASTLQDSNTTNLNRLISELEDLSEVKNLTKNEIERTISSINMDINIKTLMIILMRESNSLHNISGDAIKGVLETIKKEKQTKMPKGRAPNYTNKKRSSDQKAQPRSNIAVGQLNGKKPAQPPQQKLSFTGRGEEYKATGEDLKLNHQFFIKLAEFMFNNDLTLYQMIHTKIYDKMFNGREYELINTKAFYDLINKNGFSSNDAEKRAVTALIKTSHFIDVIEVEKISKILEELQIREDVPPSTKNFNYKHLTAPDIRLMNRIVEYMDDHDIKEVIDFIGHNRISTIEVIGNNKREDVEIIHAKDLLELLIEKSLIDDDELNEGLQMFLAISVDDIEELMIRKIKKCVKDFKSVKYFKYFGTKFRDEETVISDNEDNPDSEATAF